MGLLLIFTGMMYKQWEGLQYVCKGFWTVIIPVILNFHTTDITSKIKTKHQRKVCDLFKLLMKLPFESCCTGSKKHHNAIKYCNNSDILGKSWVMF